MPIDFKLNGKNVSQPVGKDDSLLTVLRKIHKTGLVRSACAPPGSCSHCVVAVDGIPALACLVRPAAIKGRSVQISADQTHPFLIQYSGSQLGRRFDIDKTKVVIGRGKEADLRMPDPSVSRVHARLLASDQGIELENLNTSNGTHVNFNRINKHRLRHGDIISCGTVLFKFRERLDLESAIQDMLYKLATTDQLTQVFNRRYMIDELDRFIGHFQSSGVAATILLFDLDHFKSVNDRYGHNAGDAVLKLTAKVVAKQIRPQDIFGRLGGEEFVVVLPETGAEEALVIAERCRAAMEAQPFDLMYEDGGAKKKVRHQQTLSLGVAEISAACATRDELLNAADLCLYKAKDSGRNCVVLAGAHAAKAPARKRTVNKGVRQRV